MSKKNSKHIKNKKKNNNKSYKKIAFVVVLILIVIIGIKNTQEENKNQELQIILNNEKITSKLENKILT